MAFTAGNQRAMLAELHRLAAEREEAEKQIRAQFDKATQQAQRVLSDVRQTSILRFQLDRDSTQREYTSVLGKAASDYETRREAAEEELRHITRQAKSRFSSAERRAKSKLTESTWETNTVFEATHNAPKLQLAEDEKHIGATGNTLTHIWRQANDRLTSFRLRRLVLPMPVESPAPLPMADPAAPKLNQCVERAATEMQSLNTPLAPRLLVGGTPVALIVAVWVVLCGVAFLSMGGAGWAWLIVGSIMALAAAVAGGMWLYGKALATSAARYAKLHSTLSECADLRVVALKQARERSAAETQRIIERRDLELKTIQQRFEQTITQIVAERDSSLKEAEETHVRMQADLLKARDESLAQAESVYPKRLEEIQQRYQTELHAAQTEFDADMNAARFQHDAAWEEMAQHWREGSAKLRAALEESAQENERFFPSWNNPQWNTWIPPSSPPPALRFGQLHVDLHAIPGAISTEEKLNGLIPAQFDLPALLPFPQNASLLLKASGEGRRRAIEAVQSLMLRMLTTIPPGKLRFTIIDPVGLGENFAGFMHLADHDEQLVTNRIWTEPPQIEARLADLTEQMENVIQKYLRNEFRSIDEYNAYAGEVAEPFRILVVANFPVNFTDSAARRLTSIAASGARCGVYTLMVHDIKLPLPSQFDLREVERNAVVLNWKDKQFVWDDPDYQQYPLQLETPPAEEQFTRLVQVVGRGAKVAKRVEVPFEHVAPLPEARWTGDTAGGIRVPLGRAGATKLQALKLGEGTAQHVLIAGKTGSGKSTLLHALITNVALTYSPDQIELYLIDFKKGVEFKTYATHGLPHARVIAIESEREFGLSVLEKLDAELKRRGDLYRDAGAQDVASYRAAIGQNSLPRILLVVDEFQELFTEDDKLAQDAALLLDRLVRQGRAFGIHVLLGSQTLGGAYSLARSTIGQMAVRIALQCSEADANLILSEENSAARLLSRPGEAIYNDANGLVQGNHPFQIVWLSEPQRERYLHDLQQMANQRYAATPDTRPEAPIVFEGNVPADVRRNRALTELLRASDWPLQSVPVHAWLGEAIAIKDPTAAVFRPQSGGNLLVVGQREEGAMGLLASAMISLAAQHRPSSKGAEAASGFAAGSAGQFYILQQDRPVDLPIDHPLTDLRSGLAGLSSILPHPVQSAGRRELPAMLAEIAGEIQRRQTDDDRRAPAIYLFVADIGRFRDLRRDEGDMGFSLSGEGKPRSPAQTLVSILRDGPAVGVYTLVWCDSLNTVNRSFDRQTLREFSLRVLFQMSANDSSHLIDSPLASKLGPHVAIFQNEEEGRLEKFRPYSWPPMDWLESLQEQFQRRAPAKNV